MEEYQCFLPRIEKDNLRVFFNVPEVRRYFGTITSVGEIKECLMKGSGSLLVVMMKLSGVSLRVYGCEGEEEKYSDY
jgi:hypothetical protein